MPNVIYKAFRLVQEAQAWLEGIADATTNGVFPPYRRVFRSFGARRYVRGSDRCPLFMLVTEPAVPVMPPATQRYNDPGPSTVGARQQHSVPRYTVKQEIKDEDDYDTYFDSTDDIKILPGPPPTGGRSIPQAYPIQYEWDSDIEMLDGPPSHTRTQTVPASVHVKDEDYDDIEILEALPPSAVRASMPPLNQATPARAHGAQPPAGAEEDAPPLTAPQGILVAGPVHEFELSPEQLYVLSKVQHGESVFFTGSAGTGKSVLLREIIKAKGGRPSMRLGITASTGIASINIGGCTLHSWAGIGLGKEDKEALVAKIYGIAKKAYKEDQKKRRDLWEKKRRGIQLTAEEMEFLSKDVDETRKSKILDRWRTVETLIIDESASGFFVLMGCLCRF